MSEPLPVVFHEAYEVDIGPHVFPTAKYRLVKARLLREGTIREADLSRPERARDEELSRVHTRRWLRKLREGDLDLQERFLLEVPYSNELVEGFKLCAGGAVLTARLALHRGVAAHLGGGFHHAFPDHGEGFCAINDVAVSIRALQATGEAERALVIDLDVHHGNGTAAIFSADPDVFTFSMHQERNYPAVKPAGDLDLGLPDGMGDEAYLSLLEEHLPAALDGHRPHLAWYLAGADPYREDQLGGLGLSMDGLRRRDEMVLGTLVKRGIPAAVCLAGGYARRPEDTVAIHCATIRAAAEAAGSARQASRGAGRTAKLHHSSDASRQASSSSS